MARVEYFNDPNAPRPNRIITAASAFVLDGGGRVLLMQRADNGLWALPGGAQDFGESIAQTVVRETHEETGIVVEVTGLVGVYSDPNHVMAYDDGEVRQQFNLCFRARPVGGSLRGSDESTDLGWVPPEELDSLAMHPSIRLRVNHGYAQRPEPHIG